jgi:hypothetical protein
MYILLNGMPLRILDKKVQKCKENCVLSLFNVGEKGVNKHKIKSLMGKMLIRRKRFLLIDLKAFNYIVRMSVMITYIQDFNGMDCFSQKFNDVCDCVTRVQILTPLEFIFLLLYLTFPSNQDALLSLI